MFLVTGILEGESAKGKQRWRELFNFETLLCMDLKSSSSSCGHLQVRALGVKIPDEMHIPFFGEGVGEYDIYMYTLQ